MLLVNKQQAQANFATLAEPSFKYGLGVFGKSHFGWPEEVSASSVYSVKVDSAVKVYRKEDAPAELLALVGTVAFQNNKFDAFHYANLSELLIVHVTSSVDEPVVLESVLKDNAHVQHVLVVVEEGAHVRVVDIQNSEESCKYHSHVVEVIAKARSKVRFTTLQHLDYATFNVSRKQGLVYSEADLQWVESHLGAGHSRVRTHTVLDGQGAHSTLQSLYFGVKDQLVDLKATAHHRAPHSTSKMITRGVLADTSKAVHRGFITIEKGVTKCDGYQKKETLLLSDDASVNTIPVLEIANEEVRCSHGASISHVNEDELFYLMSRGVSRADAYKMIVEGFLSSLVSDLGEGFQIYVIEQIEKRVQHLGE